MDWFDKNFSIFFIVTWVISVIIFLAFWIGVGVVAIHFLGKYW